VALKFIKKLIYYKLGESKQALKVQPELNNCIYMEITCLTHLPLCNCKAYKFIISLCSFEKSLQIYLVFRNTRKLAYFA
jgi:hypothetical protein